MVEPGCQWPASVAHLLSDACSAATISLSLQVADEANSAAVFAILRFSLDGSSLLAVVEGRVYVLDSFSGETRCKVRCWS